MSATALPPPNAAAFYKAIRVLPACIVSKVVFQPETGCWQWVGAFGHSGYPRVWDGERTVQASHVAFETIHSVLPPGSELGPQCKNKRCINPGHMVSGTRGDTIRRGAGNGGPLAANNRAKTQCPQGHPYNTENTGNSSGRRRCRACARERSRRRYALFTQPATGAISCSAHP